MNPRIVVAAALGLTLLAYVALVRPLESRIGERYRILNDERRTVADDALLPERLAQAERERSRLQAALTRYRLAAPPATQAARFLEAAAAIAARNGATLGSVEAEQPVLPARGARASFAELPLRLTVRGTYAAVLATLRDLITAPVALRLRLEALGPDSAARTRPIRLVAAVHVVLFGLSDASDVRARPR